MLGDGTGQPIGEVGMGGVECEERHHRPVEVLDVLLLDLLTSPGSSLLLPGIPVRGSFGFQFGPNPLDGLCRCPDAPGEQLPAHLLLYDPVLPGGLDPAGQPGVPRRQKNPAVRDGQHCAVGGPDGVRGRAEGEGRSGLIGIHVGSP